MRLREARIGPTGNMSKLGAGMLDLGTRTFEEIDPPQIPVWLPLLTRLADGRVLVLGGARFNVAPPFAEIYDPSSGEFHLVR